MKILWWNNPDLDRGSGETCLKILAADGTTTPVIFTGRICSGPEKLALVLDMIHDILGDRAHVVPSADCAVGSSLMMVSKTLAGRHLDLGGKGRVVYLPHEKWGKVALMGQAGAEDGDGPIHTLDMPERRKIKEFNKPSIKARIEKMRTRAVNQTRFLTVKLREAFRDRNNHTVVVALGTSPSKSLWDHSDPSKEQNYSPFYVSKTMGDLLDYRDGLKTRIPTIVLCSGGHTPKAIRKSPTLALIQPGHQDRIHGVITTLEIGVNGEYEILGATAPV